MQTWTGGGKRATVLALTGVMTLGAFLVWVSDDPLKQSVTTLSEKLPAYWECFQKLPIKIGRQSVLADEKLQEGVSAEIARESTETGEMGPASPSVRPHRSESLQSGNTLWWLAEAH